MTQQRWMRWGCGLRRAVMAALVTTCGFIVTDALAQSGGMGVSDFESARDSFFNSADRDGDFALSDAELISAIGHSNGHLFDCQDDDGDGLCGYSEYLAFGQRLFQQLDSDGDGWLSPNEIQ